MESLRRRSGNGHILLFQDIQGCMEANYDVPLSLCAGIVAMLVIMQALKSCRKVGFCSKFDGCSLITTNTGWV